MPDAVYCTSNNQSMHDVALLNINKPEIHQDFYFEMSMICYFQLLIQKA